MKTPRIIKSRITLIIGGVLLVAAFVAWLFIAEQGRDFISAPIDKNRYPINGIDISSHNGLINFEKVAADSVDFVMIKATEGATFKDKQFVDNYRRARKAGLKVGAYHFFRFDTPGHLQALNLLNSVKGRNFDLPLAIDVEDWTNPDNQSVDAVLGRLWEMTDYIQAKGYPLILYTNKDGYARYFLRPGKNSLPLWLASFSEPDTNYPWTMWQHTHRGNINGIDGKVDLNTFNGSREEWEKWLLSMQ